MPDKKARILINKAVNVIDNFYPSRASILGLHSYDAKHESFCEKNRSETVDSLISISRELSQIPFHSLNLLMKAEILISSAEIYKTIHKLENEKIWEWDPNCYLIPFACSIYYMLERDYGNDKEKGENLILKMNHYLFFLKEGMEYLMPVSPFHIRNAIFVSFGLKLYIEEKRRSLLSRYKSVSEKLGIIIESVIKAITLFTDFLSNVLLVKAEKMKCFSCDTIEDYIFKYDLINYSSDELWTIAQEKFFEAETMLKKQSIRMTGEKNWQNLLKKISANHPEIQTITDAYTQSILKAKKFSSEWTAPINAYETTSIKETPYFFRMQYPTAGYSSSGCFEKKQETFFWLTPIIETPDRDGIEMQLAEHCYGRIQFVTIHEAYPGHHFHMAYAAQNKSSIVRRGDSAITAEGWAVYCENLARENGYFDDEGILSSLEAKIWRAARMMVETGIHSGRMSFSDAFLLLTEKLGTSGEVAENEIAGCIVNPGAASCYCIGEKEIENMKSGFLEKFPSQSISVFHQNLIGYGCIPAELISVLIGISKESKLDIIKENLINRINALIE